MWWAHDLVTAVSLPSKQIYKSLPSIEIPGTAFAILISGFMPSENIGWTKSQWLVNTQLAISNCRFCGQSAAISIWIVCSFLFILHNIYVNNSISYSLPTFPFFHPLIQFPCDIYIFCYNGPVHVLTCSADALTLSKLSMDPSSVLATRGDNDNEAGSRFYGKLLPWSWLVLVRLMLVNYTLHCGDIAIIFHTLSN